MTANSRIKDQMSLFTFFYAILLITSNFVNLYDIFLLCLHYWTVSIE